MKEIICHVTISISDFFIMHGHGKLYETLGPLIEYKTITVPVNSIFIMNSGSYSEKIKYGEYVFKIIERKNMIMYCNNEK